MREARTREPGVSLADSAEEPGIEVLQEAMRQRQRVLARHGGYVILFCPHLLTCRSDGHYVLAFIITAELGLVAEKLCSPKRWRWLRLAHLSGMDTVAGSWRSAPSASQPPLAGAVL